MKNPTMKKLVGLTAAAALAMSSAALADTAQSALVQGGRLNLRQTPSLTARVLGQYPTGTLVEITEAGDQWCKVIVNGKTGYMMTKYLNLSGGSVTATVRTNTGVGLNLREEPSLSGAIITSYKTGTVVTVLQKGATWSRVAIDGQEGFMSTQYLRFGNAPTGPVTPPAATTATVQTNSDKGLNLREEPSANSNIITSYKSGTVVTVLNRGDSWTRVSVNGQEGYMFTSFLRFGADTPGTPSVPSTGKVAIVNNPRPTQVLNLRQQPSLDAKVLDYYYNGVKVTILESGSTWHKVQVEDGKIGYMMAKYLLTTGDTAATQPYTATLFNANGGRIVNFRSMPSLSGSIISTIPVGTQVTVLEHGTDWCKVQYNGVTGYISTWFMK